jgi:glutamate-ammonia-ligase adenylyltransferase
MNPIPESGPERIGPSIADSAGRAVEALFSYHCGALTPVAIVAAGSLAARRAHFRSDLDLVAVTAEEEAVPEAAAAVRAILEGAREAGVGPIDLRLRGEGENAPLVRTLASYETYVESRADLWEILAYSKCRFLCGDVRTGRAFEEMLGAALPGLFARGDWKAELGRSRAKLESLSRSPWDVKHAPGGLYDMDFMLSAACLRRLLDSPGGPDPSGAFEYLRTIGLLGGDDPAILSRAYRLFWTIEHAAALHGIPYPPLPEREEFFERYLGRLLGDSLPGAGTFLERLRSTRGDVRRAFARFFNKIG